MYDEFKFFTMNKNEWQKGFGINIHITDNGIQLENDSYEGVYYSLGIDSTESEMLWHRMVLETDTYKEGDIKLYYFASDDKVINIDGKNYDIDMLIMDNTYPNRKNELEKIWSFVGDDFKEKLGELFMPWLWPITRPSDILLHKSKGRYFWFKVEFKGSKNNNPCIKKARIYYPRMSYLDYLPSAYSSDEKSRDFLERFLSIFSSIMSDMEENIANVSRLFDIDCVDGEYLKWLASWLSIKVDESWGEKQLKVLVERAPEIYKRRGTKQAIVDIVEIYTGSKPMIVEHFQIKNIEKNPKLRELYNELYSIDPYTFCVIVRADCVPSLQHQIALQKLLDEEKPAFTTVKLIILQPLIYLDSHSYLGYNTTLSNLPTIRLDEESSNLFNNILLDKDEELK